MHKRFDHKEIEKKWQEKWKHDGIYNVNERDDSKEKEYVLVEWPYPSGNLHIGHWHAFAVPDIYVRHQRMQGKQMLFPIGFDAFGLPAENAAIKRNINPREWTESNIEYMKTQLNSMGNSFSWTNTTSSTDPEYYKWTQWMFAEFFKNDIAYRGEGTVNWCPGCNTVIANEQVQPDDTCERCDSLVEKKKMPQWMLRITDFANELIDDLEPLDWPEHIKDSQRNWIGRSEGAEVSFELSTGDKIIVFTTRPDTLFGATYLVLAPEHELILEYKHQITNWSEVDEYIKESKSKAEQDRLDNTKEKTGVKLEGITAINPANGETIPVFIADYVLATYGTGAIMAVPAHDERDNAFAKKFGIEIRQVIAKVFDERENPVRKRTGAYALIENEKGEYLILKFKSQHYYWLPGGGVEPCETIDECLLRELKEETGFSNFTDLRKISDFFFDFTPEDKEDEDGRNHAIVYAAKVNTKDQREDSYTEFEANNDLTINWISKEEISEFIEKNQEKHRADFVKAAIEAAEGKTYTNPGILVNSEGFYGINSAKAGKAIVDKVGGRMTNTYRLRDWSIGRQRYWGVPIPIVYDPEGIAHPIPKEHLPWTLPEDVDFKPTGVPPLSKSKELKERTEKIFGSGWTPEVETMDTFVDSSWYYLRYIDNKNNDEFSCLQAQQTWLPVDIYFGGAEHTTMHLLYSRFWQKALKRLGLVENSEAYNRRINRGLIIGPDGNKMSKSKGNVIDPDEQVKLVGADTVKMYLAFMGPYGETANYPWDMGGIAGLRRFLERVYGLAEHITKDESKQSLAQLHKTILKVTSDVQVFKFNTAISAMMVYVNLVEKEGLSKDSYEQFLKILAPFAPHMTEELWVESGNSGSVHLEQWPSYDIELTKDDMVTIGVQINGKLRGDITVSPDASEDEVLEAVKQNKALEERIHGLELKKVVYVPGRILNLVIPN